jgi:CheY-like chemotaxis protein
MGEPALNEVCASREQPALDGLHILLIDDDEYIRTALGDGLEFLGAQVTLAASAAEARKALALRAPDLILSDLSMPHEDGFTFMSRMRADGSAIPAAALTANASVGVRERALESGFAAVLYKPFELASLSQAVRDLLGQDVAASKNRL